MIPQITKDLIKEIQTNSVNKSQKYSLPENTTIEVPAWGFPPISKHSRSTYIMYKDMNALKNKIILDIGTGSGVLAILAAKYGALQVDAIETHKASITIARKNAIRNSVKDKITFYHTDNLEEVSNKYYDYIIANLPYLDLPLPNNNPVWKSLFDPELTLHKEVFSKGTKLLQPNGKILSSHADMLGKNEFERVEYLAQTYDLIPTVLDEIIYRNISWRKYSFEKVNA